jgi:membrane protease YdiL (CAAX protease family)
VTVVLSALAAAVASTLAFVRAHPFASYLVTAFAFSWSDWLSLAANGDRIIFGRLPTDMAGMAGPAFAAFAVTAVAGGERGLRELALRVVRVPLRNPWLWLLAPSPLWVALATVAVLTALGEPVPSVALLARYPGIPALPLVTVFDLVVLGVGFGQEIGWRGLALPRLQARRGPLGGAILTAVPWGVWLFPLLLVNNAWRRSGSEVLVTLAVSVVLLAASSVVLAFVVARTDGSLATAAFWHGSLRMGTATEGARGVVGGVLAASVVVGAVVVVAAELRARRRGHTLLQPIPRDSPA